MSCCPTLGKHLKTFNRQWLWSHSRMIDVLATDRIVQYRIPLYIERKTIGNIKGIFIDQLTFNNNFLVAEFNLSAESSPNLLE